MSEEIIRLIITDDHKLVRDGLQALLDNVQTIKVVGEASNGNQLMELLPTTPADVILMDLNMPEKGGLETVPLVKELYPDIKILMLSMLNQQSYIKKAIESGASGYLLKTADKEELRSAIHLAAKGMSYFSPAIYTDMLYDNRQEAEPAPNAEQYHISAREMEVLRLIAKGFTNAEIADKLFNSKRTIETHRHNLLQKTNCKNTANLVSFAIKNGII